MKKSLLIVLLGIQSIMIFAQYSSDYKIVWESIIENERVKALDEIEKIKENSLEYLFTKEIVRSENGLYENVSENFYKNAILHEDFQYYLYALWNEYMFFNDYLSVGFDKKTSHRVKNILENAQLTDKTVQDALFYLNAVIGRYNRDWKQYSSNIEKIDAITEWSYCGVFENMNKSGLDIVYDPENFPENTKGFNANSNGVVNWYVPILDKEVYQLFLNHNEYGSGVQYAQTFIKNEKKRRIVLNLGSGSALKVWLNDVIVFENSHDVITDLDAYKIKITLPKGVNRLLVKTAENNLSSYFIAKITNENGNSIKDIQYTSVYEKYNQSNKGELEIQPEEHSIEKFFKDKIEQYPNNFLYTYCLIKTYFRNSKYEEAKEILIPLSYKYPKSSIIRKLLIFAYNFEKDYEIAKEIKENLELDDPNYILSLIYKLQDQSELKRMNLNELEEYLARLKSATDLDFMKDATEIIYYTRKEDKINLKKKTNEIIKNTDWLFLKKRYARLYDGLGDKDRAIEILEKENKNFYDDELITILADYYDKKGEKDKVIQLFSEFYLYAENNISLIFDFVNYLHKYEKYEESIPYIDQALKCFPYSFVAMNLKGEALYQLGKKKESLEYFEKSLSYNSGASSLRKKIQDIKNEADLIDELYIEDLYGLIESKRKNITENNYGFNILLDKETLMLYNEGGGRSRTSFIYEITSEKGVERFKEYNLGLSGNYNFIKSEIVKENRSIIPADKSGSNIVFSGLEVGDVIYIDYEEFFSNTGRFYKDFVDYFGFYSYHPMLHSSYTMILPKDKFFNYKIVNGSLDYKKQTKSKYDIYTWEKKDVNIMPREESYKPKDIDLGLYLHFSTIESWRDIAYWYSDLVRNQMETNSEVEKVIKEIFPNGVTNLSEEMKAKKIYEYMSKNLNYSSVSFRQSNFIPQKPSKTLKSKLGDCKDFSTLFVVLAKKVGLEANLVLVNTSDNGKKSMILPSQDFNHCIVRVKIDDIKYYIELTDKYLPFKAQPLSLYGALILNIPIQTDVNDDDYQLIELKDEKHSKTTKQFNVDIKLNDELQEIKIDSDFTGANNSSYLKIFDNPNQKAIEEIFLESVYNNVGNDVVINEVRCVECIRSDEHLKIKTSLEKKEKIKNIGDLKVFQLPKVVIIWNNSIIENDKRSYPIKYIDYENTDYYEVDYNIEIPKNNKWVEIPSSKKFNFKEHFYSIDFKKIKENILSINIVCKTSKEDIRIEDYAEFKKYVKNILDVEESLIGYK